MTVKLSPFGPKPHFEDSSGNPLSGGKLYFYINGSTTPQNTYTDSTGGVANANPVVLNSRGEPTNEIWFTEALTYKAVLKTSADVTIWSVDNIVGINDIASQLGDEWKNPGLTPTFVSATSFSLVGDQTTEFHVGRRLKSTNTGGTIYSTIKTSVFAAATTVTVENDSGVLDSGLSAVSYAILRRTNPSLPGMSVIRDTGGNEAIIVSATASAVNEITATNAATGNKPRIAATGTDSNVSLALRSKGTGEIVQEDVSGTNVGWMGQKYIAGLTYANGDGVGGGDATNDITIAAGAGRDSTNAKNIVLASAITKQLDAAWAVGTAAGGLDTGAIGNSDYYIWLIMRSDTGVVDALFSLSSTAPTMPTSYDYKRIIGWFKRVGATIVAFHTYETDGGGLELLWDSPTLDIDLAATLTTARRTDAVKVPLNFSTIAQLNVALNDAAAWQAYIYCPDLTDVAPSVTVAPLSSMRGETAGSTWQGVMRVRTSAAGLIAARASTATIDTYRAATVGFQWSRR